jgi:hypothetical protein
MESYILHLRGKRLADQILSSLLYFIFFILVVNLRNGMSRVFRGLFELICSNVDVHLAFGRKGIYRQRLSPTADLRVSRVL